MKAQTAVSVQARLSRVYTRFLQQYQDNVKKKKKKKNSDDPDQSVLIR